MKLSQVILIFTLSVILCLCENKIKKVRKYDFIIVGGGTAGLTLAHELSETSNFTILVIEAGSYSLHNESWNHFDKLNSVFDWQYATQNENLVWHTGKKLGGTSELSYTIYTQGFQNDYDVWGQNNPGWSYKDVKRYFLKLDKNKKQNDTNYQQNREKLELREAKITTAGVTFFRGMKQLGYNQLPNVHRNHTKPGYTRLGTYNRNRQRTTLYQDLLLDLVDRKNVIFKTDTLVTKIKVNATTKWASAVLASYNGTLYRLVARKEIILCAGVVGTAKILLLSGVGPKEDLEKLKIRVLEELPVGKGVKDHISYPGLGYMTNYNSNRNKLARTIQTGGSEAMAFLSLDHNKNSKRPDVELLVFNKLLNEKFKMVTSVSNDYYENVFKGAENLYGLHIFPILLHPKSEGQIKLRSKNSESEPLIESNYLSDDADVEKLTEAILFVDETLVRTPAFKKKAATLYPVPVCSEFPYKSKAYWRCAVKKMSMSMGDYMGGCRMGSRTEQLSVVDNELRVYGLQNVRIADACVIPTTISAPLEATVIMIARKAADLIRNKYL